jgi:hypothetical protein
MFLSRPFTPHLPVHRLAAVCTTLAPEHYPRPTRAALVRRCSKVVLPD